jgi:hypothetical protein
MKIIRQNFNQLFLLFVFISVGGAYTAQAIIIELPLECEGEYGFYDTWTADFDLGVEFIEISSVCMDWSGEITASQGMWNLIAFQFVASLYESDPHDYYARTYVAGGKTTYPNPEPFDLLSQFEDEDWIMLLDGQSNIEIWFGDTIHLLDSVTSAGTGSLDSATLVIEGTIIPEPATLSLLALGAILAGRKK